MAELFRRFTHVIAPLTRRLAGRRYFTLWALVTYEGRRTGRTYSIPIAIQATPEGFVIPLPFEHAQWFQNVLAAGGCTVRWNGTDYAAGDPQVVGIEAVRNEFGSFQQLTMRALGMRRFLHLTRDLA